MLKPAGLAVTGLALGLSLLSPLFGGQAHFGGASALGLCGSLPVGSRLADGSRLSAAQEANAAIIVSVARATGAGAPGAVDALDAALTESRLENDHFGTGGAFGLFQETPADGWGSVAEVENPIYAARAFFSRLVAIPEWSLLAPAVAAQDVERSAWPDRYRRFVHDAEELASGLLGRACTNAMPPLPGATTMLPATYSLPASTVAQAAGAIEYALGELGHPYVWGGTGPVGFDCSGLVMMAYRSVGIDLPRTTYAQVHAGEAVDSLAQLQPGDLLFTEGVDPGPGGAPGHVGMYVGDGLVIDAPETGHPVELTPLASWVSQIVAIRQVVA